MDGRDLPTVGIASVSWPKLMSALPDAELVVLESRNHVIVRHEPAWSEFFAAVRRFVLAHADEA